jgi:hypothetical protein
VAAEHVALAAQHGAATFASDAQTRAARAGWAGRTADSDTPEGTRDVRSGGAVHRGAFAGDQPRLTARASTDESAGIAGTSQAASCGQTGLIPQTGCTNQAAGAQSTRRTEATTSLATKTAPRLTG